MTAGAWAHYSYALLDAIDACDSPVVEVHISNMYVHLFSVRFAEVGADTRDRMCSHAREEFRHKSVTAPKCAGMISGCGILGYEVSPRREVQRGSRNR